MPNNFNRSHQSPGGNPHPTKTTSTPTPKQSPQPLTVLTDSAAKRKQQSNANVLPMPSPRAQINAKIRGSLNSLTASLDATTTGPIATNGQAKTGDSDLGK